MSTMALSSVSSSCCIVFSSFLLLLTLVATGCFSHQDSFNISANSIGDVATKPRSRHVFLETTKAKAFIKDRQKRIWWLWEESEEEEESHAAERRKEIEHQNRLAQTCRSNCWGVWSGWGSCSSTCGNNGTKTATRKIAPPSSCRAWVNTHGCPGRSCKSVPCNRFCNNSGTPRAGSCACKPGDYGTCCQLRDTCEFPGRPANGEVTPSGGRSNFGTVARFSCSIGYRLVGSSTRTCQTNGHWDGDTPRCDINSCPNPGTPANGKTVGTSFQYRKTVMFHCNSGYRLTGTSYSKCLASGMWSHIPPKCQVVNCPALSSPTGGSVLVGVHPVYRSVATYSCNTGYYMVGPRTRTCQASGRWDGSDTKCSRTTCSNLPPPQNGDVVYSGGSWFWSSNVRYHGQRALFSCRPGYTLKGSASRTCGGSGTRGVWSGSQTTCIPQTSAAP